MRKINPQMLLVASDIFSNLSAGWFGAVFILPAFSERPISFNFPILFINIIIGIICFVVAFKLKQIGGKT